mgnify:CR=1 FL=1
MTLEQRIATERDARLAEKCGELALALAKSNERIARLTEALERANEIIAGHHYRSWEMGDEDTEEPPVVTVETAP